MSQIYTYEFMALYVMIWNSITIGSYRIIKKELHAVMQAIKDLEVEIKRTNRLPLNYEERIEENNAKDQFYFIIEFYQ